LETCGCATDPVNDPASRGVSDFDRTHRLVVSYLWELPKPGFANRSAPSRLLFTNWELSGIITAMSGLPIDVVDAGAGSLYGLTGGGARASWAPGSTRSTATSNIPAGYFFNPFAFARARLIGGQPIPSSGGAAVAD